ncbi:DNA polymerase delta small subunit Cdc1 [Oleoguttula sp. CCFEE 5521]
MCGSESSAMGEEARITASAYVQRYFQAVENEERRCTQPFPSLTRKPASYSPLTDFTLPKGDARHYQQQYADMYFARLAQLKPSVEALAAEAWSDFEIASETARKVDRALDVRQGELCWVIGTIYMEMPLKPNILDDIGKEHWIAAPPPRVKFLTPGGLGGDQTMLEDESGRLRLVGGALESMLLVTGAIVAVLGTENADGDFEVLDLRVPDLPRQPVRWEREDGRAAVGKQKAEKREEGGKVAIVSGLGISGDAGDTLTLDLLLEYLLGESAGSEDQVSVSAMSRLIIAGNSLAHASPIPPRDETTTNGQKKAPHAKKYGYDSSAYNAAPTDRLDLFLSSLLPSLPVTLLPGADDPTSISLPQQPIHQAMFPHSRTYQSPPKTSPAEPGSFDSGTNPYAFDLHGWRFLGTGGQPVDDIYKYVTGEERLEMMEAMLRWRLVAPTAPDTLWCYPFPDGDAFVLRECPHVFFVGNQPKFESTVVEGPLGQQCRIVAVPSFRDTGEVVVLDLETLEPEIVKFEIFED